MAGQLKVNGVTLATEESGTVTLEAPQIKDSSNNVILDQSGTNPVLKNVEVVNDSSMMFRNKIINGGMNISQRGTSFSFAHDGTLQTYTLDRFNFRCGGISQYDTTVSQYSMSAAELNTTGHSKALKILTGTAESAISSGTNVRLEYKTEAQDLQDLQYGTASARTVTLSFWVKSSVTGTYAVNLYKADTTYRMINKTYTINTANTWEKKIISIVGDTDSTGSIVNDNGEGLRIMWVLATGSDFNSSSATTWADYSSTNFLAGHVQNGVVTTGGADWYLTGVQLEIGSSATPFEHRPIGMELSLCERYFQIFDTTTYVPLGTMVFYSASEGLCNFTFPTKMRGNPTLLSTPQLNLVYNGNVINFSSTSVTFNQSSNNSASLKLTGASGFAAFDSVNCFCRGDIQPVKMQAEL
jgi:hypothetical protein